MSKSETPRRHTPTPKNGNGNGNATNGRGKGAAGAAAPREEEVLPGQPPNTRAIRSHHKDLGVRRAIARERDSSGRRPGGIPIECLVRGDLAHAASILRHDEDLAAASAVADERDPSTVG